MKWTNIKKGEEFYNNKKPPIVIMVESKIFDQEESPPLVPVASAPHEDTFIHADSFTLDEYPVVTIDGEFVDDLTMTNTEETEHSLMVGAGIAAGALGCLIGGPILACLAGFGTAHYTTKEGAGGDCARAIGHIALAARFKADEVNRKHGLVEKGQQAVGDAWEKAKEMDRRHNLLDRTKAFVTSSWDSMKEANRKHHILERAVEGVGKALTFLAMKINKTFFKESPQPPRETNATDHTQENTTMALDPGGPTHRGYAVVSH